MTRTRKIINWTLTLAITSSMIWVLASNKTAMDEEAIAASKSSLYIPVETTTLQHAPMTNTFNAGGTLQAVHELKLLSETQGRITRIFHNEGEKLKKGDIIVKVDDELLRANMSLLEVNYEKCLKDYERMQNLNAGNAISKNQLEQSRLAYKKAEADLISIRRRVADTEVKAPIKGTLNKDYYEEGSLLSPGIPVCDIVDISRLKAVLKLTEEEIMQVSGGDTVSISIPSAKATPYRGVITTIAVKGDASMKFDVEIEFNNTSSILKAGMYANVTFTGNNTHPVWLIPRAAITGSIKMPEVFIAQGEKAEKRKITTGRIMDDKVEVTGGLDATDALIVKGQLNLTDGRRIKIMNQ